MSHEMEDSDDLGQYPAIEQQAANPPEPPPAVPTDLDMLDLDSTLKFTQGVRLHAIKTIQKSMAQEVNSELVNTMLKAASDMDKGVVNRRRVGIEEAAAQTAEQSQRDTAALLRAMGAKLDPFRVDNAPPRTTPQLGSDLPPLEGVPGEKEIGRQEMNYDGFAKDLQQPS